MFADAAQDPNTHKTFTSRLSSFERGRLRIRLDEDFNPETVSPSRRTAMEMKPVEKFNSRDELYYECPVEGCDWTFSTAVRYSNRQSAGAEYAKRLNEDFAEHVKQARPPTLIDKLLRGE